MRGDIKIIYSIGLRMIYARNPIDSRISAATLSSRTKVPIVVYPPMCKRQTNVG